MFLAFAAARAHLLIHAHCVDQHCRVLCSKAVFQYSGPQPVLVHEINLSQMQNLGFAFIELHVSDNPLLQVSSE